jgi:hypothetical protein
MLNTAAIDITAALWHTVHSSMFLPPRKKRQAACILNGTLVRETRSSQRARLRFAGIARLQLRPGVCVCSHSESSQVIPTHLGYG